ncbi:hypothetical protein [Maribellus maritimus]|uniref:hypothetical protein n=1 Tax=Maribellus maritimus TaxID=2870838 RepID=UPI001EECD41B|nr:hypothetical protein [Maribellus maritimus]MCG6186773.1 hypothetical protein [Maribellus maritimus]
MTEVQVQFQKKREPGDIFSDSFRFLKQEFKPVAKLFAIYILPFIIIYGILQVYVQIKVLGKVDLNNPDMLLSNIGPIYGNIFIISLFGIFVQSLLGGTYYTYIEYYIKKGKGNFELSEITPLFFSNSLIALGANLLLFIAVIAGVIMCIVPGIYFANTFSIVVMILIFEKKGVGNAFTRSWNLVNSQWWNTFLVNLVGIIIIYIVSFLVSIPAMIAGIGSTMFSLQQTGTIDYPQWYWILTGFSVIVSAILWIIPYTFLAFQYFNLDERTKPNPPQTQNSLE